MRGFAVRPDNARPPCIFRRHLYFFIVITIIAFNFIALHATFFRRVDSIMSTYYRESPVVAWTAQAPPVTCSASAQLVPSTEHSSQAAKLPCLHGIRLEEA